MQPEETGDFSSEHIPEFTVLIYLKLYYQATTNY